MRGKCYDGAATMSGAKSGVVTRMCQAEPRAVFTYCYGYSLNLAFSDTMKQCKIMHDALFKHLKEEMASDCPGIRVLCPTRWTVRAEALLIITDNYSVLLELWDGSLVHCKDTEMNPQLMMQCLSI